MSQQGFRLDGGQFPGMGPIPMVERIGVDGSRADIVGRRDLIPISQRISPATDATEKF
jgi:hypothetical protein